MYVYLGSDIYFICLEVEIITDKLWLNSPEWVNIILMLNFSTFTLIF